MSLGLGLPTLFIAHAYDHLLGALAGAPRGAVEQEGQSGQSLSESVH